MKDVDAVGSLSEEEEVTAGCRKGDGSGAELKHPGYRSQKLLTTSYLDGIGAHSSGLVSRLPADGLASSAAWQQQPTCACQAGVLSLFADLEIQNVGVVGSQAVRLKLA